MQTGKRSHLKSKIFMRLFFSYVIIIVLFFSAYAGYIISMSRSIYRQGVEQAYQQKTDALNNQMDVQLLSAQSMVAGINNSETIKDMYNRIFVEEKVVDALLLYKTQGEMKSIKASSGNINIYSILLNFKGDAKTFTASMVIPLNRPADTLGQIPYFGVNTVGGLWDITDSSYMMLNKEYLIYGDAYYVTFNGSVKGSILVLFEKNTIDALMHNVLGDYAGIAVFHNGWPILEEGNREGQLFTASSSVLKGLTYEVYVDEAAFVQPFISAAYLPLFIALVLGVAFIVGTYFISKQYYRPFGNIEKIMETETPESGDEIEGILGGIRDLIGERNGYRERMVTISPYARQGMLHGILSGNVQEDRLQILIDEQYIDLKMPYFAVAVANIAFTGDGEVPPIRFADVIDIIQHVCQAQSNEDLQIVCYVKNLHDVFIIANANQDQVFEETFYLLHQQIVQEIEDDRYAVTIGVGQVENDLSRLREACEDAQQALDFMLVGGRNAVYFHEKPLQEEEKAYFFPKDAVKRLAKALADGDTGELHAFLDELYARNVRDAEISPANLRLMVDELHVTVRNALRTASGTNTTHIHISKIENAATIDEIFAYYGAIFDTVCDQLETLVDSDQSVQQLQDEIIAYIDANYLSPDISLAMLADHFGVSTKYVGEVCKEKTGRTYLQYVRERQIHYAAELLRTTDESLESIAAKSGFTNMLTFRRNFKAVMKMNPSDYRE